LVRSNAVLFDFGGTLDADGVTWKERVRRLCRDEGLDVGPERFDPLFHAADDALVGAVSPALSFRDTVSRLVSGLARGLRLEDEAVVGRIATGFLDGARETLRRNAPVLAALSGRYRLGIVSNFYGNLATVCDDCEIRRFFTVVVDSERVGCRKPDPRIFQHALDALGVAPREALFVGDSLTRDMAGARDLGMPHVWLAGAADPGQACCPDDRQIRALPELEDLLL
jgi:putative hydrolase of the HAD superfamily